MIPPGCSYLTDGGITLTITGGTTPYRYQWNTGDTEGELNNLSGGFYKVTMIDAHNCQLEDSTLLSQPTAIHINLGFKDTVLCVGQTIILDAGNLGATYSWKSDSNNFTESNQVVAINKDV